MCNTINLPHRAFRVSRAVPEGQAGVTLLLDGCLQAEPGQFVMIWLPGIEERPYSLMSGDPASLTVAEVGPFSVALCALKPGDRLWLRGPFGRGFRPHGRRHLLLGGGSGVAPLAFFAERAIQQKHEATAVIGARTAELLMLRWRFKELGCRVLLATDDGTLGIAGTVLDAAGDLLLTAWPEAVYACGPEPMLRAVALRAEELRLPCWVSMERVMKCGLGVCGSCYCGDRLVCVDGPVFSGSELLRALEPA